MIEKEKKRRLLKPGEKVVLKKLHTYREIQKGKAEEEMGKGKECGKAKGNGIRK